MCNYCAVEYVPRFTFYIEYCKQRNIERGDRYESQSEEQTALMNPEIAYRLRVDAFKLSPEECADAILRELFDK